MDLEQRLARLERGNRRMKRIGALVLVVAGAALLSGQAKGKDLPDLEVGSLTLRDKDGRRRAVLSARADGPVRLALIDKEGKALAGFIMGEFAAVFLSDKAGTMRVKLGLAPDGSPALILSDKDGRPRAGIDVLAGSPTLTLYDANGDVIWKAPK